MTSRLDVEPWPWQPDKCPADQEFIEWLMEHKREKWMAGTVFHMGPGDHHRVPRACINFGLECISITVSEGELLMQPHLDGYRCILQNIWNLDPKKLPEIHFMTFFHIGEMAGEYGDIDYDKMDALIERVTPGGHVFFYARSSAWDRQMLYLHYALNKGDIKQVYQHKSVLVCRKI